MVATNNRHVVAKGVPLIRGIVSSELGRASGAIVGCFGKGPPFQQLDDIDESGRQLQPCKHLCTRGYTGLGSHLARLEVKVMLQQIRRRLPDYTVDESKLELHHDVGIAYGYEAVPIRFAPGERLLSTV